MISAAAATTATLPPLNPSYFVSIVAAIAGLLVGEDNLPKYLPFSIKDEHYFLLSAMIGGEWLHEKLTKGILKSRLLEVTDVNMATTENHGRQKSGEQWGKPRLNTEGDKSVA